MQLLSSILTETPYALPDDFNDYIDDILTLAKKQDVFVLICYSIKNNKGKLNNETENKMIGEVFRYTQNDYVLKLATRVFNHEEIPFIPLKGAVIRTLYPQAIMRNACDVDILVNEKDLERAISALVKAGFSTDNKRQYHDVSLYYNNAHLELHFSICENMPRIDGVLSQVWRYSERDNEYKYKESPAFFAYHCLAHLLYHFLRGGCSIKQFVDLWLLRHNRIYEEADLRPLLKQSKIEKFYEVICETLDSWFEGKSATELTNEIKKQVINGGFEMNRELVDEVNVIMSGGKVRFFKSAFFLSLRDMQWVYPKLRTYPFLLPFFYIKRLYTKTIGSQKGRLKDIMSIDARNRSSQELKLIELLEKMDLN